MVVQVGEDIAQLDGPRQDLRLGLRVFPFAQHRLEVFALDEFHDQVGTAVLGEVVVDARDGGVGERGQQIGLALEVPHDHLVHRRVGGHVDHFFDGDELGDVGEMQVATLVDRAHAARAEHAQDQVAVLKRDAGLHLAELPGLACLTFKGPRCAAHKCRR